jgi:hypothetical protein
MLVFRLVVAPNADRAAGFTAAFLAAGGAEVAVALLRTAALSCPAETDAAPGGDVDSMYGQTVGGGGGGGGGGDDDGDEDGGDGVPEMVAGCVRLLGHLMGRAEVLQLSEGGGAGGVAAGVGGGSLGFSAAGGDRGVTPALAERAIRHCLRHAPMKLLTEEVYDAALRAALDTTGSSGISSSSGATMKRSGGGSRNNLNSLNAGGGGGGGGGGAGR